MNRILLVDWSNLVHRAYHVTALKGMTIRRCSGFPTNAVAKSATMLANLIRFTEPNRVIFGLDGGSDFRRGFYPEYKALRKPKAPELAQQIPVVESFIRDSGAEYVHQEGQECDDLLMSLATVAKGRAGVEVLIATHDKDYSQVVGDNVTWLIPITGGWKRCDAATVKEDFGVPPSQMDRYLSLVGDVTDNTPGIEGIGPVTAVSLLSGEPDDEQLVDLVANKKNWPRERAATEMALNFRLIRPNLIAGLKPQAGNDLPKVLERLEQRNCLDAASIWSQFAEDFGRDAVVRPKVEAHAPEIPPPAPQVLPPLPRPRQGELTFA